MENVLNFKSKRAYEVFISCKDNHKAWQSLEIFLHGTVLELIHLYVQQTNVSNADPLDFLRWQSTVKSATLKMMFQFVFKFALGIYVQRVGDRNNNALISDAGQFVFSDLFYGFRHPLYQEIEYRDLKNKAIYPVEVKNQGAKNLTYSSSHEPSRCQGGDFMLEQKVNFHSFKFTHVSHKR